jgi:gliding motility-associated-like protein
MLHFLKILLIQLLLFSICKVAGAQGPVLTITQGDSINLPCTANCTVLNAQFPKVNKTTSYSVSNIPYSPTAQVVPYTLTLAGDDYFSDTIGIGFDFCFYNGIYNKVCISDNGQITFNTTYAGTTASFATQDPLPNYNSSFPDLAIFGPMIDAKLSLGGLIKYETIGQAPFRKFVVKYDAVPYFNNNCGGTVTSTFQIELLETFNQVQCHIASKPVCNAVNSNWLNYATLGIQGTAATGVVTAPAKNASTWTASNESFAFTPAGTKAYNLTWVTSLGATVGNLDSLSLCFNGKTKIYCKVIYDCPSATFSDTIKVTVPQPKFDSVQIVRPSCLTDTNGCITIFASGNAPFTYSKGNLVYQTSNTICGVGAGPKFFYVKDANGCLKDTSIFIKPISEPKIILDSVKPENCPLLDGFAYVHTIQGIAPYSYVWDNGDTTSVLSNVQGDKYYLVTVTDALGCTTASQVYVPAKGLPKITAQIIKPTCQLQNGSITLSPTNLGTTYNYLWSATGNTTNYLGPISSGSHAVLVTAPNGCDTLISYVVADTLTAVLSCVTTPTRCGLNNGKIQATGNSGIAPYQYYLNNVLTQPPFTGLAAGTYTVKLVDSNGCTKTSIQNVMPSVGPTMNFLKANAHCDSSNGTATIIPVNAISPITFLWANGIANATVNGLAPMQYYVATFTDSAQCLVTDSVFIGDDGSPKLKIVSFQQPSCHGFKDGSVVLSGVGGIAPYKYSVDTVNFSAVAQINGIGGGNYVINIKDASGCIRDTLVTFQQPDSLYPIYAQPEDLVCYDDIANDFLFAAGGGKPPYNFELISTNGGALANNTVSNLKGGKHLILVTDITGCKDSFEIIINQPPEPLVANLVASGVPCYQQTGGQLELATTGGWGGNTITWPEFPQFNGSTWLQNLSADWYKVQVVDVKGCIVSDSMEVEQLYCCEAYVPNAFTPNGDNLNSTLRILTRSDIFQVRFKVFNRWGNEVFSSLDATTAWDGTYNGLPCTSDTYFYILEYNCVQKKTRLTVKGDVQLIR